MTEVEGYIHRVSAQHWLGLRAKQALRNIHIYMFPHLSARKTLSFLQFNSLNHLTAKESKACTSTHEGDRRAMPEAGKEERE